MVRWLDRCGMYVGGYLCVAPMCMRIVLSTDFTERTSHNQKNFRAETQRTQRKEEVKFPRRGYSVSLAN